jgi:hypothetical protein
LRSYLKTTRHKVAESASVEDEEKKSNKKIMSSLTSSLGRATPAEVGTNQYPILYSTPPRNTRQGQNVSTPTLTSRTRVPEATGSATRRLSFDNADLASQERVSRQANFVPTIDPAFWLSENRGERCDTSRISQTFGDDIFYPIVRQRGVGPGQLEDVSDIFLQFFRDLFEEVSSEIVNGEPSDDEFMCRSAIDRAMIETTREMNDELSRHGYRFQLKFPPVPAFSISVKSNADLPENALDYRGFNTGRANPIAGSAVGSRLSGRDIEQRARTPRSWEADRYTVDQFVAQANETLRTAPESINLSAADYNNLLNTLQCFDVLEAGNRGAAEYVEESPRQNIVMLAPPPRGQLLGTSAICATREELANSLHQLTAITIPCVGNNNTSFPADISARFIRLSLGDSNIYVPEAQVWHIVESGGEDTNTIQLFQAESTNVRIPVTATVDAIQENNFVSADHCQAGTDKTIYNLRPIVSDELFAYNQQQFEEEQNRVAQGCQETFSRGNFQAHHLGECSIGEQYDLGNVEAFGEEYAETLLNVTPLEFRRRNMLIQQECEQQYGQYIPSDYRTRRLSRCLTQEQLQNLSEEQFNEYEAQVRQRCIDDAQDYEPGNFTERTFGNCVNTGEPYELGQIEALRTPEEEMQAQEEEQRQFAAMRRRLPSL